MKHLRMSMGLPELDPNDVLEALKIRHLRELDSKRYDAVTLIGMVHLAIEGGDPLKAMSHLYSKQELDSIAKAKEEAEERRKQEQLLRTLEMYAISKGLGLNDRRSHD